jgi:hypothetical protein
MKSRLQIFSNTHLIIPELKNLAVSAPELDDLEYPILG